MIPYIEQMVKDFTKENDTMEISETPSSDHLFKTTYDAIVLEETHDDIYHNTVTKALFSTNG